MKQSTNTEAFIRRLKRLEKDWPEDLWIFANGQNLYILKVGEDGERVMTGPNGGVNPDYIVVALNIPSDGGDF